MLKCKNFAFYNWRSGIIIRCSKRGEHENKKDIAILINISKPKKNSKYYGLMSFHLFFSFPFMSL